MEFKDKKIIITTGTVYTPTPWDEYYEKNDEYELENNFNNVDELYDEIRKRLQGKGGDL